MSFLIQKIALFKVLHDGDRVIVLRDGECIINVPWEQALDIAKAIHVHAHKAEEMMKAEQIIRQEAALMRSGAPISLVTNWEMKKEAGKEAAWGWVRKYLPNRIRQTGHVFAPSVKVLPPKE